MQRAVSRKGRNLLKPASVCESFYRGNQWRAVSAVGRNHFIGPLPVLSGQPICQMPPRRGQCVSLVKPYALHIRLERFNLNAASLESHESRGAEFGRSPLPKSRDKLFIVFIQIKARFVTSRDQVAHADATNVAV